MSYQWKKGSNNIAGATSSSYTTPATAIGDSATVFTVVVSNSAGTVTSSNAALTVNAAVVAPAIATQPTAQALAVTAGNTATFTVVATGNGTLSYQWKKNGSDISGATSSTYTTPATTNADIGAVLAYSVVVSNSAGSRVTSNSAAR